MIAHLLSSSVALGAFTALMGLVSCTPLAFANRREYRYCPRWLAFAYRTTWLMTGAAWAVRGATTIFKIDDGLVGLAPSAAVLAGALLGLYFMILMRRSWPFANR